MTTFVCKALYKAMYLHVYNLYFHQNITPGPDGHVQCSVLSCPCLLYWARIFSCFIEGETLRWPLVSSGFCPCYDCYWPELTRTNQSYVAVGSVQVLCGVSWGREEGCIKVLLRQEKRLCVQGKLKSHKNLNFLINNNNEKVFKNSFKIHSTWLITVGDREEEWHREKNEVDWVWLQASTGFCQTWGFLRTHEMNINLSSLLFESRVTLLPNNLAEHLKPGQLCK